MKNLTKKYNKILITNLYCYIWMVLNFKKNDFESHNELGYFLYTLCVRFVDKKNDSVNKNFASYFKMIINNRRKQNFNEIIK